jgi:hypothetical protein
MLNESSDRKTPLTIERTWFARTENMALLEGEIALIAVLREPEGAVLERRTLACLKAPCMLPSPPPLLGGWWSCAGRLCGLPAGSRWGEVLRHGVLYRRCSCPFLRSGWRNSWPPMGWPLRRAPISPLLIRSNLHHSGGRLLDHLDPIGKSSFVITPGGKRSVM